MMGFIALSLNESGAPLPLLSLLAHPSLWMSPGLFGNLQPMPSQGYSPLGSGWALWGPPEAGQGAAARRTGEASPALSTAHGEGQEAARPLPWVTEGTEAPAVLELPLPTYPVPRCQHSLGTLDREELLWGECWVQKNLGCVLVLKARR